METRTTVTRAKCPAAEDRFRPVREYAWVTSLVENQAEGNVGQFVTVQFNLLDSDGEILASATRSSRFRARIRSSQWAHRWRFPTVGKSPRWRPPWRSATTRTSTLNRSPRSPPER